MSNVKSAYVTTPSTCQKISQTNVKSLKNQFFFLKQEKDTKSGKIRLFGNFSVLLQINLQTQ